MRNIIDSLAKLSGEEKRRYMETSSDTVMYMLSQSKEKIKESISNSIFDTLDIKEKIESLESVIVIKPWGEKELLWWVVVLDLIIYLCNKLSIDIQEIKEVKISPEMIDVIYHWEPADKNNSQVYHDLCMYFWSWMSTIIKIKWDNIIEKANLIKLHIRLLYIAKNQGKYNFIKNVLHSPDINEIDDNLKALWYIK